MPTDKTYPEFEVETSLIDSDLAVGWRAGNPIGTKNIQITWLNVAGYMSGKLSNVNIAGTLRYGAGNVASGVASFAGGQGCTASNFNSIALGVDCFAAGNSAVALGDLNSSSGDKSFSMGTNNSAQNTNAVAMGVNNTASGSASVAMGMGNTASAQGAVAMGQSCQATKPGSVSVGITNLSSGNNSFTAGQDNIASGGASLAVGVQTVSSAAGSFTANGLTQCDSEWSASFGLDTRNDSFASIVLGQWNSTSGTKTSWVATDPLVQGGNGTSDGSRSNAFTILKNGKMAIGPTLPTANENDMLLNKDGVLSLKETATPTADTNFGKVYTKNDNKIYFQDGAGAEHEIAFV